jgi:peptidoglycan hydrolase-like protein with peptidoglycan-binding domain
MQALLLRHQRQSDVCKDRRSAGLLKENGFYHGPVDGTMNQRTREALPSFQESRQLNVTEGSVCVTARLNRVAAGLIIQHE